MGKIVLVVVHCFDASSTIKSPTVTVIRYYAVMEGMKGNGYYVVAHVIAVTSGHKIPSQSTRLQTQLTPYASKQKAVTRENSELVVIKLAPSISECCRCQCG